MLPAGILKERAKLSGVDLDWRTTKEPTGLSDKISIVMSLKIDNDSTLLKFN